MAVTQFLSRSPAKKVPSGADLKVKSPLVLTVRQPKRYHLGIKLILFMLQITILLETYSFSGVIESATIIFSTSFTLLVILISRPLSRKDCP